MRIVSLFEGATLAVRDYRCEAGPADRAVVECFNEHSISYVREGSFGCSARGHAHELVAGAFLIGHPGDEYLCTHDHHAGGDTCLSFHYDASLVEAIGDARWFIDKAVAYAKDRKVFNRPIGQNQGVQFPIAKAYAATEAAALMVRRAAELYDSGADCGAEANMAKMLAAEASWMAADMCVQTHGGFGFAEEFDVERKFREARLYQVAPISTNLILSYLAEHVLGLPRSY